MAWKTLAKKFLLLYLPMILAQFAVSQSMHSSASGSWDTPTLVSNLTGACIVVSGVQPFNCWHKMGVSATGLSRIFASNGNVVHIYVPVGGSLPGAASTYNEYPTNTWTAHPEWGKVAEVEYTSTGDIWALVTNSNCPSGSYGLEKWNGSAFVQLNSGDCASTFAIANDGTDTMWRILGGNVFVSTNEDGSWTQLTSGATYTWIFPVDGLNDIYLTVKAGQDTMWRFVGSTGTQIVPAPGQPGATGAAAVIEDYAGTIYKFGVPQVLFLNSAGKFETIYGGGIVSVADDGNSLWATGTLGVQRWSKTGLQFGRAWGGSVGCDNGVPPAECATFTHTTTGKISVGTGSNVRTGAVDNATPFNGPGTFGVHPVVVREDPYLCAEDPEACDPFVNNVDMNCNGGGSNTDNPPIVVPEYKEAFTHLKRGVGPPYHDPKTGWDTYPAAPNCSNTSAPLYNPPSVRARSYTPGIYNYFHVAGNCVRLQNLTPWVCVDSLNPGGTAQSFQSKVNYEAPWPYCDTP